jgi:GGDEF domain-containing protein
MPGGPFRAICTYVAAFLELRRRILLASVGWFVLVFGLFVLVERPGMGIAHAFYIPVLLVGLATGPFWGAAAGVVATALYAVGVVVNPHIPIAFPLVATLIRLVTFVLVGSMIGYFASVHRRFLGGAHELVEELTVLASRDIATGLPNTRGFASAIGRRLELGDPFALLVGSPDSPIGLRPDELRAFGDRLGGYLAPSDEAARVGDEQFAVLVAAATPELAGREAVRFERQLGASGLAVTFGWATYPRDGKDALALFQAADERMYARKVLRGEARPVIELAG